VILETVCTWPHSGEGRVNIWPDLKQEFSHEIMAQPVFPFKVANERREGYPRLPRLEIQIEQGCVKAWDGLGTFKKGLPSWNGDVTIGWASGRALIPYPWFDPPESCLSLSKCKLDFGGCQLRHQLQSTLSGLRSIQPFILSQFRILPTHFFQRLLGSLLWLRCPRLFGPEL